MLREIIGSKLDNGFSILLLKETNSNPTIYEVHQRHPTGVVKILKRTIVLSDAFVSYTKTIAGFILK